ncbi:MAG: hypothetical protein E6R13_07595 [Spirochaetes bacterium]|nr:MAG: hypothetical protein E6R13_07595 [Spirochaetota bacterium]
MRKLLIYKGKNDVMYWLGVPTNKFKDLHGETITESAHKDFIKRVDNGSAMYPALLIWHIPKPIGHAEWLAWDSRGYLLAAGQVWKEYEDLVIKLLENEPNMGMSHGMPPSSVILKNKIYLRYDSVEFSLLPQDEAANRLTKYVTI